MPAWKASENTDILVVFGIIALTFLIITLLLGPQIWTPEGFLGPMVMFLVLAVMAAWVMQRERKERQKQGAAGDASGTAEGGDNLDSRSSRSPGENAFRPGRPAIRWRAGTDPSFLKVGDFGMGIGFFAGFIVLVLFLVAVSDVDPVMKAGGFAVSLLILAGYVYSVKAIVDFIRRAAGETGLEEFQVDETGVSFWNLLPEKWRMGLYFIAMAGMGDQTTALTKDSTFIPWGNIHYLRMKPDDLTIMIGTVEGWAPFSQSDSPMILLSCTEENYPLVEEYIRRYLSQTPQGNKLL